MGRTDTDLRVVRGYAARADDVRPLRGYATVMAIYAAGAAAVAGIARLTGKQLPERPPTGDLALMAVATHKISRLLTKDAVTSPLRAPFTEFHGTQGPAELKEEVRGTGARKAIGELVTCPFCTGMWISTGLCAGLVFAPGVTRLAAGGLTALTGSDFLHFLRAKLMSSE